MKFKVRLKPDPADDACRIESSDARLKLDGDVRYCGAFAYARLFAPPPFGLPRSDGAQQTRPAVTAPCAMRRCVPLASMRCGLHATAGSTGAPGGAMHDWRIPHSCAWSIWPFVQAAAASRRLDALSTVQWRSPVSENAHHACLREHDESPRVRIRPPASMAICRHACPRVRVEPFPSQALRLSFMDREHCPASCRGVNVTQPKCHEADSR